MEQDPTTEQTAPEVISPQTVVERLIAKGERLYLELPPSLQRLVFVDDPAWVRGRITEEELNRAEANPPLNQV